MGGHSGQEETLGRGDRAHGVLKMVRIQISGEMTGKHILGKYQNQKY
jgi:hypothetical protein